MPTSLLACLTWQWCLWRSVTNESHAARGWHSILVRCVCVCVLFACTLSTRWRQQRQQQQYCCISNDCVAPTQRTWNTCEFVKNYRCVCTLLILCKHTDTPSTAETVFSFGCEQKCKIFIFRIYTVYGWIFAHPTMISRAFWKDVQTQNVLYGKPI